MSHANPALHQPMLAAIQSVQGTVAMARALVDAGRRIDLAGLDADAAVLCTAIGMLPPDRARPLRQPLEALLRDVDGLTAALVA
jgi:hypothetical protein